MRKDNLYLIVGIGLLYFGLGYLIIFADFFISLPFVIIGAMVLFLIFKKKKYDVKDLIIILSITIAFFSLLYTIHGVRATIEGNTLALGLFKEEQRIARESDLRDQKVLIDSLILEVDDNIHTIDSFENNKEKFKTTDEYPLYRFSSVILKQALEEVRIGDYNVRKGMYLIYKQVSLQNRMLDRLGVLITSDEIEYAIYMKFKREDIDSISDLNQRVLRPNLVLLKSELEEINISINVSETITWINYSFLT